jgi:hypothetical protein
VSAQLTSALIFRGTKDPATAAPINPVTGDVWVMSKTGVMSASWTGLAGTSAQVHDLAVWDGAEWDLMGPAVATTVHTVTGTAPLHASGTTTVTLTVDDASEAAKGVVQLATAAETTAGTDGSRAVTPAGLKAASPWRRTGTEIATTASGDSVYLTGMLKIGGTSANPAVDISTGSPSAMLTRTADGKIGVGTHNPETMFHLLSGTRGVLTVSPSSDPAAAGEYAAIRFRSIVSSYGAQNYSEIVGYNDTPGVHTNALKFLVRGVSSAVLVDAMRLDSAGNLVLGGTLPAAPNIKLGADGLGTFANGLRVGKTGTSTTVQTVPLQITNSSKWQRMGLTCAGGEIKFMTDDNESGAPISPTFSFKNKLGAEFLHVDCNTGDLLLGGTPPAAPNIALKANGSIVANTDGLVYDATTKRLGIGIADPNYYSNEFVVYGSSPTYAGSASFVNDSAAADSIVQRQGFLSQAGGTAAGISVWQNSFIVEGQAIGGLALGAYNSAGAIKFYTGALRTEHARITPAGDFLFGGTLPAAPNIALKADGSIVANTDGLVYDATTKRLGIGIADPNYYSNEFVVYGSSPTYAGSASFVNDSAAADSIVQRQGFLSQAGGTAAGISVWQNSFIVEGQAIGGLALGAYNSAGAIKFYTGGFRTEHARITPAGDFLFGGTLPAAPNIALKADGNIRAKGAVSRVYADNAAAKAGGLVAGDVYRKADGTLMITF